MVDTPSSPHNKTLGDRLKLYWTKGEGLPRWANNPHPWTTLHALLLAIPLTDPLAARLTKSYYEDVFGHPSGERKGKNPKGPG